MRADTVDCVMFILRAASMKLPVSATIRKVRARVTSMELTVRCQGPKNLSMEISDSGHRKIPFVDGVDSHQIGHVPTESNPIRLYSVGFTMQGQQLCRTKCTRLRM